MAPHTFNLAGDKHEFDPERWTTMTDQNGPQQNGLHQNGATTRSGLPKRHPKTGINILIVGAGMGGLMTLLECWRKGHNIVGILERNEGPVYTGSHRVTCPHVEIASS